RRFGSHFHRLVSEFNAREYWKAEEFQQYQRQQLSKLLTAASLSPYYRQVFAEAGVDVGRLGLAKLSRLPLLSKKILSTNAKGLLTQTTVSKSTLVFKSSGTTGTPTEIYYTREFHALELALPESRNLKWAKVTHRDRRVMFGVRKVCAFEQNRPPFWRYSPAENLAYASVYHLSPRFLPHYIEFLRAYRPDIIMGYPSALHTIARYSLDKQDLPAPAKAIFTTSEVVTPQARGAIEAVWRARIFDR